MIPKLIGNVSGNGDQPISRRRNINRWIHQTIARQVRTTQFRARWRTRTTSWSMDLQTMEHDWLQKMFILCPWMWCQWLGECELVQGSWEVACWHLHEISIRLPNQILHQKETWLGITLNNSRFKYNSAMIQCLIKKKFGLRR